MNEVKVQPRPFVKWAGGKRLLVPELLKRVPRSYDTYREPFLGGGAMFFALRPKRAVLSDSCTALVRAYRGVRDGVNEVVVLLRDLQAHHGPDQYEVVKASMFDVVSDFEAAARLIYINKTCFNGLYRVNSKGQFNVSIGKFVKPPMICDEVNLRACSEALQGVELMAVDFRDSLKGAAPDDLVYCDPPFLPASKTSSFVGYTSEGFGPVDHLELAAKLARLRREGVRVMLSNASNGIMKQLYEFAGFKVEEVEARRHISCHASERGVVTDIVVT